MNKIEINKLPELSWEVSEAVNQLRVNLSFCGSDVKTIMVTSSTPNEGKSFVAMQLWKSIERWVPRRCLSTVTSASPFCAPAMGSPAVAT